MRSYLSDFNKLAADRLAMKRDGLSLAHAGIHNGSNAAHLAALGYDALPANKRAKDGGDDALDIILASPTIEELVAQTYQRLSEAEDAVDRLIEKATQRFQAEQSKLVDLEAQSAQTADGTRVARDKEGNIVNIETGRKISDSDAATIIWRGDEPSMEAIDAQRERAEQAHDVLERARGSEARLGEIRHEMTEGEPNRERLNEVQDEIADIATQTAADLALIDKAEVGATVTPDLNANAITCRSSDLI